MQKQATFDSILDPQNSMYAHPDVHAHRQDVGAAHGGGGEGGGGGVFSFTVSTGGSRDKHTASMLASLRNSFDKLNIHRATCVC